MNGAGQISAAQLRALQSLWSACARHSPDVGEGGDLRVARLAWASALVGRTLASFRELRADEALRLIDLLKQQLGQPNKTWRGPRDRESARAAGRHGRKGVIAEVPMLASREDIERVHAMRERAGMSLEGFEAWLRSRSSPLGRFGDPVLRTVADCNRVYWALKSMLRRAGDYKAVCFKCQGRPGYRTYFSAGAAACGLKKHHQYSHSLAVRTTQSARIIGWDQRAENRKQRARVEYRKVLADAVTFFLSEYRLEKFADAIHPILRGHVRLYEFKKLEQFRKVWKLAPATGGGRV